MVRISCMVQAQWQGHDSVVQRAELGTRQQVTRTRAKRIKILRGEIFDEGNPPLAREIINSGIANFPELPSRDRLIGGTMAELANSSGEPLQCRGTDRLDPVLAGKTGSPRALQGGRQVPRRCDQGREPVSQPVHASQVSAVSYETVQGRVYPIGRVFHLPYQDTYFIGRSSAFKCGYQTIQATLQQFAIEQNFITGPDDPVN